MSKKYSRRGLCADYRWRHRCIWGGLRILAGPQAFAQPLNLPVRLKPRPEVLCVRDQNLSAPQPSDLDAP